MLDIVNTGNFAAEGTATIELFASADGSVDDTDTPLRTITRHIRIGARHAGVVQIRFKAPSGMPGGSYSLLADVTSHTVPTDANAGHDVATTATRAK